MRTQYRSADQVFGVLLLLNAGLLIAQWVRELAFRVALLHCALQVYLARWQETLVAVKLLLGTAASMANIDAVAEESLSLSNPVLAQLQEVSGLQQIRLPVVLCVHVLCASVPHIPSCSLCLQMQEAGFLAALR